MINEEKNFEATELGLEESEQVTSSARSKRSTKSRTTSNKVTGSSSKTSKSRKRTAVVPEEMDEDDGLMALFFGMEDDGEVGAAEVQATDEVVETQNSCDIPWGQEFTSRGVPVQDGTELGLIEQVAELETREEVVEIANPELSAEQQVQELAPVYLTAESSVLDLFPILQESREVPAPSATSATPASIADVEITLSTAIEGTESLELSSGVSEIAEQLEVQQDTLVTSQEESHEDQLAQLVAELSDDVAELDVVWGVSTASETATTDTNEVVASQPEIETTEVTGAVSSEDIGETSVGIGQEIDSVTTVSVKEQNSEAAADEVVEEIAVTAITETTEITEVIDPAAITDINEAKEVVEAPETAEATGVDEIESAKVANAEAIVLQEVEDVESRVAEFVPPLQVDAQPRVLVDSFILPATLGMMSVRGVVGKDTTQDQLHQQVTTQVATPAQTSTLLEQALLQQLASPIVGTGNSSSSVASDSNVGSIAGSELSPHSSNSALSQTVSHKPNAQEVTEATTESAHAEARKKSTSRKQQAKNSAKSKTKESSQTAEVSAAAQKKQELDFECKLGFNSLSKLFKVTSELSTWTQAWQDGKLPLPCVVAEQDVATGTAQGAVGARTNQGVASVGTTGATDNARSFIFPWEKVLTSSKELKSLIAVWLADIDYPTLTQPQLMELELWYWIYQYAEQQLGQVLTPSSIEMLAHYLGLVRGVHALGDGLDTSGGVWQVLPHLREIPVAQYQVKDAYAYRNLVTELQAVSPEQVQQRMHSIRKRMTQLRHAQSLQHQLGTNMQQHSAATSSTSAILSTSPTSSTTSAVASRATSTNKEQSDV